MLNKKIDTEEIERKNKVVDNAISVLKTEFIGIDNHAVVIVDFLSKDSVADIQMIQRNL